jgi:uncharacterized membrane protein YphA (DoxX/SURF4 family)
MRLRLSAVFASSLLLFLFGYTAISKLVERSSFEIILSRTPFISPGAAALAWLVPLSELGIVLLLLFGRTRLWGLYCAVGLLCFFTVYLLLLLVSGEKLPCNCGGVIGELGWWEHIGLNAGMAVVGWLGIRDCESPGQSG